jgi:hypothetical protein
MFSFKKQITLVLASFLSVILLVASAQAAMISTQSVIVGAPAPLDRSALMAQLANPEMQQKLVDMGVSQTLAAERLSSLTELELAQFNDQLENAPAASGAAGILLAVFIVLVVTDMLCATDVFSFVRCINK